ncbi:L-aspartate oxidase [Elysia marginata]|uniref:L-aspartate oxidase n=1 Tax=Elysia marginata TaxID=1093978 RepID=A0AAV4FTB0_9GAST|nr:L-aspartate oxidase [Elysia marginata]
MIVLSLFHEAVCGMLIIINQELRVRLPDAPHVTLSTIHNVLKGQLITMKKLGDAPAQRNSERMKTQRRAFATWLLQNAQRYNFIYIDEAGINIWTKRTRGRARRGDRACSANCPMETWT